MSTEFFDLAGRIRAAFPLATVDMDPPSHEQGKHHLDVRLGDRLVVVEGNAQLGFGVLLVLDAALDEGPDFRLADADRALGIVKLLLSEVQDAESGDWTEVHRDLKPDNIFVTESGVTKLLDFGIAKVLQHRRPQPWSQRNVPNSPEWVVASSSKLTRVGTIMGTLPYMSPEQWGIGIGVDHRTDLWACGVLLFQMICGRHPLYPRNGSELVVTAMLDLPMPSMSEAAPPGVPRKLTSVVDRCLFKIKEQRWQSAADLLAALSPFLPVGATESDVAKPHITPAVMMRTGELTAHPGMQPQDEVAVPGDRHGLHRQPLNAWGNVASGSARGELSQSHLQSAANQQVTVLQPQASRNSLLFVAAEPTGSGGNTVGQQARVIRVELERTIARDRFELVTCLAPEALDLLRFFRKHKPIVVYFAGSGASGGERRIGQGLLGSVGGIYVRGRDGRPHLLAPTTLQETFGAAGASVRLVVLDRCYSKLQAEALLLHVDCVVGTAGTARPELTEAYAIGFFGALGDFESVATAHKHGCAAASLEGLPDDDRPQIKVRSGVDAGKLVLAL